MNLMAEKVEISGPPGRYLNDEERWSAVLRRDPEADRSFFYSVKTTGVYCRPSCSARTALVENVSFHASAAEAERLGFRPCKRCRPDLAPKSERQAALIAAACRSIEGAEEPPRLETLAGAAGMSPHHFHRLFRRIVGVTPRAYADAHRNNRVRNKLADSPDVTEAIYDSGFNSSGRFYETAGQILGMTPTAYRKGGAGEEIRYAVADCSLGKVLVAATARGICAILMGETEPALAAELRYRFPEAAWSSPDADFNSLVAGVVRLIDEPDKDHVALPLDIRGTSFQRQVWAALRDIPKGSTKTYAQVAAEIGRPEAARAVAGACAANRLAVAIPCHRVVKSSGQAGGYRWGVERKQTLLRKERQ